MPASLALKPVRPLQMPFALPRSCGCGGFYVVWIVRMM